MSASFTLAIKKWAQRKHLKSLQNSVGILVTGSKADVNVTSGQYVIVQDSTISGITDGLYKAGANVTAGTSFTSSNLTAVSNGIANTLSDQIANKVNMISGLTDSANKTLELPGQGYNIICVSNGAIGGIVIAFEFSGIYKLTGDDISTLATTSGRTITFTTAYTRYMILYSN